MASFKSSSKKHRKPAKTRSIAELNALPTAADMPVLLSTRAKALDALAFESRREHFVEAVRRVRDLDDAVRLNMLQSQPTDVACRKGCSWCCSLKVGTTVPEVIAIADYLEKVPEFRKAVQAKVSERVQAASVSSPSDVPQHRPACALLLDDGSCGVYEVRPVPCRSWLSTDEASCKKFAIGVGEPKFVFDVARSGRSIQLGLVKVMDDIQRLPYLVELTFALDVALNEPRAIERWIAGEPVFERASVSLID